MRKRYRGVFDWLRDDAAIWMPPRGWPCANQLASLGCGGGSVAAPTISSFTPAQAPQGMTVVITGTNLTGATAVTLGGTNAASFVVNSSTQITATLGAGATGSVAVTTPGGTASKTGFTFADLNTSLTSFWKLSEASGATRNDSVGSRNLTDHNTVTQVAGISGHAAGFAAASSQYLSVASDSGIQMNGTDFTIAAWVKFTTLPASNNEMGLVTKLTSGSDREYYFGILNSAGTITFEIVVRNTGDTTNTTLKATTFGAPSTATWYMVACGFRSVDNSLWISVNDGTKDTVSYTNGVRASTNALCLGAFANPTLFLDGALDAVGIWRKQLANAEVTAFYNAGAPIEVTSSNWALASA